VPPLAIAGIGLLIAWRIYSRVRRLVGRQHFRPVRAWMSLILGTLLAYYARHAWGLIRWSRSVAQTPSP
jgi:hypothetical protein